MFEFEKSQSANFMAGGRNEPLIALENPLLQQAAALGEGALATVARFRPLSRAVFSYVHAVGLLAQADVCDAIKAEANAPNVVEALRMLSPSRVLEAAHGGRIPKGLLCVLKHVSATQGITEYDAKWVMRWTTPSCNTDEQRARLLLEALATLERQHGAVIPINFSLLVSNIRDLPEHSLGFLRLRELRTVRELTQSIGGADAFEITIGHMASVCSSFNQFKDQIAQDLRAGKPLGPVLRQILEDHADDLPKPKFPMHAALEVLRPKQALELSTEWRNCIRDMWIDSVLAGDICFVRSTAYELVARLRSVSGPNSSQLWMLDEIAAPKNKSPDPGQASMFVSELQRGNVVVVPERERICDFLESVIALRHFL